MPAGCSLDGLGQRRNFTRGNINPIPPAARCSSLKHGLEQPVGSAGFKDLCMDQDLGISLFRKFLLPVTLLSSSQRRNPQRRECSAHPSPSRTRNSRTCKDISISISSFLIPIQTGFPLTFCAMVLRSLSLKLPRSWGRKKMYQSQHQEHVSGNNTPDPRKKGRRCWRDCPAQEEDLSLYT